MPFIGVIKVIIDDDTEDGAFKSLDKLEKFCQKSVVKKGKKKYHGIWVKDFDITEVDKAGKVI